MRIAPSLYSMLTLVYLAVVPAITSGRISPDARLRPTAWMGELARWEGSTGCDLMCWACLKTSA